MSESEENALTWVRQLQAASDSLNAEHFVTNFYTEDATLQFGNYPPIQGRQNVIDMFKSQFSLFDMMKHETEHFDVVPDRIYIQANISYRLKGDTEVIVIPSMGVFHKTAEEQKVRRADVFVDASPLIGRMKSLGLD